MIGTELRFSLLRSRDVISLLLNLIVAVGVVWSSQQVSMAADEAEAAPTLVTAPVAQTDTTFKLSFSKDVKVTSVKIGGIDVPIGSPSASRDLYVTIPSGVPLGRQTVIVQIETKDPKGAPTTSEPLTSSVIVAPLILGLKPNKDAPIDSSRVVIPEGEVIVQFNGKIPAEIRERLKVFLRDTVPVDKKQTQTETTHEILGWIAEDTYLVVPVPKIEGAFIDVEKKTFGIDVIVDGVTLQKETKIRIVHETWMYLGALGVLALLTLLIYVLFRVFYKVATGQQRFNFVKMLLLEQENQTYSLSRAQFLGWLVVIIFCYLFLYYAHGFIEGKWYFPNLGNAVYAFFISLGTLVVAQGTSLAQGPKGAGELHPSLADLVVHGGVLALDRVQQVIWTLIALGMFVRITISTYATASALPEIPMELVALMGLSSAGYLGGKIIRGAGPIIEDVVPSGSLVLNVKGRQLSKDAFVWFDGAQIEKGKVEPVADDTSDPVKFAKELKLTLDMTMEAWNIGRHAITVINPDAQRADWRTPLEINITPGAPDADGKVTLTIKTAHATKGATVTIPDGKAVQDDADPNKFTAVVDAAWLKEPHDVVLTSEGEKLVGKYRPSS